MAIYYYAYGYASVPVLSIAVAVWLVVCLPCSGLVYLYERSICQAVSYMLLSGLLWCAVVFDVCKTVRWRSVWLPTWCWCSVVVQCVVSGVYGVRGVVGYVRVSIYACACYGVALCLRSTSIMMASRWFTLSLWLSLVLSVYAQLWRWYGCLVFLYGGLGDDVIRMLMVVYADVICL